jgi:hypothetical protein
MVNLGTLKEITDLRSIWPHEALNFTPWVAENVDLLADAVGLDITVDETESSVGDFNVDIYASETGTDRKIIIENQLEDTDHDHLGKLITYASGKGADVVIWVVKHAREEHKAAVEWLNNHTDDKIGFFLCEIKLFQIGDSQIAPAFTVVGRLLMFKECLKHNIVPFIIEDDLKMFYYRGLKEWNREKGYLMDTCLTAQDRYKAYLDYFRIPY